MSHDPLREALRSLPRERASDGFNQRLAGRLHEPPRRRPALARPFALAAALSALLATGWLWREQALDRERRERLGELRREQQALAAELEAIREQAAGVAPVVYLGGDDATDVVVDLARLAQRRAHEVVPARFERGGLEARPNY